jgi:soluble lytic murein transglycosylase-like protein
MIEDMYAVFDRINEIKKRFGIKRRESSLHSENSFQSEMDKRVLESQGNNTEKLNSKSQATEKAATRHDFSISEIKEIAKQSAKKNRVPEDLVLAMIKTESSYNPKAVSPKGAKGLMQLMPDVINAMGVSDPFSPEENINAGVKLIKNLLDKYNWNYKTALAAYNAGENAVDKNGDVPPYNETREYITKVISNYLKNGK